MNITKIKTGFGSQNIRCIKTSANTELTIYFNDVEFPIITDSNGEYFFNNKRESLPLECMTYVNMSVVSELYNKVFVMGDLENDNMCEYVSMEIFMFDKYNKVMKPVIAIVERGRIFFPYDTELRPKISYDGVV